MNPIFQNSGLTPTAAIALRAEQQEARAAFIAKAQESAAAKGVSLSRDSYNSNAVAKLNATKMGADGNPVEVKFLWNPETKVVTLQQSAPVVSAPQIRRTR